MKEKCPGEVGQGAEPGQRARLGRAMHVTCFVNSATQLRKQKFQALRCQPILPAPPALPSPITSSRRRLCLSRRALHRATASRPPFRNVLAGLDNPPWAQLVVTEPPSSPAGFRQPATASAETQQTLRRCLRLSTEHNIQWESGRVDEWPCQLWRV